MPVVRAVCILALLWRAPWVCAAGPGIDTQLDLLFGTHAPFHEFFDSLQSAAAAGDPAALSAMIAYPLTVRHSGKAVLTVRSPAALHAHAGRVFTKPVKDAIARQRWEQLFANQQGVMIGAGELWFGYVCERVTCAHQDMKITAVNLP